MAMVNVHEAKTHLSRLLERAAKGERIVIARAGKPVAVLGPLSESSQLRRPGRLKGRIRLAKDFDAPLPDALLDSFHSGPIEPE